MVSISTLASRIGAPAIGGIILCGVFAVVMSREGLKKYNLTFFISKDFLFLGLGSLLLAAFFANYLGGNLRGVINQDITANTTYLILPMIFLSLMAITFYKNIKQSNVLFGIFYTFAQIFTWMILYLAIMIGVVINA